MSTKLNQLVAIEKGVKNQTTRIETDLYQSLEKKPLFTGLSRTYKPKDEEDGDQLPPEQAIVQLKTNGILKQLTVALTRLIDVIATKDTANTFAVADVTVDGLTIAADVPVTTLLFLEKEIEKLAAFVGRLPVLDPAQQWEYDPNIGAYSSEPIQTVRTKKVPKNHEVAPATKEHPAQVQVFTEDVVVGYWTKRDFSGALRADDIAGIKSRLDQLRTAVKFAREEANGIDVTDIQYGAAILNFLFGEQVSG